VRPPHATFRLGGELEVNRLGFGAMRITRIPRRDAHAILRRAVELGANLISQLHRVDENVPIEESVGGGEDSGESLVGLAMNGLAALPPPEPGAQLLHG
jgi:aryl-alcohol dehydrogenase-like predicted oxidoreductase